MRSWVSQLPASFGIVWQNWGDAVGGFIKLDRSILSWLWYEDANTFRVWIHLLLTANIADHDFSGITIHRGQLATSYQNIAKALQITSKQARTAIEHLRSTGEITTVSYPRFQLINIENYNAFQARQGKGMVNGRVEDDVSARQRAGYENATSACDNNGFESLENREMAGSKAGCFDNTGQGAGTKLGNNIRNKNIYSLSQREKPCFQVDSVPYKAALWLSRDLCKSVPSMRPQGEDTLQAWAADFDALHNAGYEWEAISDALTFAREDAFWKTRISGAGAFRKNFNSVLVAMGGEVCG